MDVGARLYMYDVAVKKFTFAISSPGEFLSLISQNFNCRVRRNARPLWECFLVPTLELGVIKLHTKFEMPSFNRSKNRTVAP